MKNPMGQNIDYHKTKNLSPHVAERYSFSIHLHHPSPPPFLYLISP